MCFYKQIILVDCNTYFIFLGIFECVASNKEGSGSSKGQLEIVEFIEKGKSDAPEFLKKIGDEMVFRGMAARFTALVAGYPEPEYEWFFNGKPLFPTDRYRKIIYKNVWSLITKLDNYKIGQ